MTTVTINKSKAEYYRTAAFFLITFLIFFSYIEHAIAGTPASPYIDTLKHELVEFLIKDHVCEDREICRKIIHMQGAGYSRIYLNMYEQTDTILASHVAVFFIKEGLKITNGTPITLSTYPKSVDNYMGFKYFLGNNEYLINFEINK